MTHDIHSRARALVAQSPAPMTLSEAYTALARRRRPKYGTLRADPASAKDFAHVESQTRYAWQNRADLA